jgi:Derlin-2/3
MLEEKFSHHVHPTADMLTMLLFGIVNIWILDYFVIPPQYFYGSSLVFMCIYVWSRKDPYAEIVFYGFSFKAWHTPFLFLVVGMLLGGNPILDLLGIALGHLYFFLMEIVPMNWGYRLLWTPDWMINAVKAAQARVAGVPVVNSAAPRPNWQHGAGHRLG